MAPSVRLEKGVTVVTLDDSCKQIDERQVDALRPVLGPLGTQIDPPLLVLDMSHVAFFGSSFIEVLFRLWNGLNARQGRFALVGLNKNCREVLAITHLDSLWGLYGSTDDAVEALKPVPTPK